MLLHRFSLDYYEKGDMEGESAKILEKLRNLLFLTYFKGSKTSFFEQNFIIMRSFKIHRFFSIYAGCIVKKTIRKEKTRFLKNIRKAIFVPEKASKVMVLVTKNGTFLKNCAFILIKSNFAGILGFSCELIKFRLLKIAY